MRPIFSQKDWNYTKNTQRLLLKKTWPTRIPTRKKKCKNGEKKRKQIRNHFYTESIDPPTPRLRRASPKIRRFGAGLSPWGLRSEGHTSAPPSPVQILC